MYLSFANKTRLLRLLIEIIFQAIRWLSSPDANFYLAVSKTSHDNKDDSSFIRSQKNQGRNHFSYLCFLWLQTDCWYLIVQGSFKQFRGQQDCESCSRCYINIGWYFPHGYWLPQYGGCSTEALWILQWCASLSPPPLAWWLPCSNIGHHTQGLIQADNDYSCGYTPGLIQSDINLNTGSKWVLEEPKDKHFVLLKFHHPLHCSFIYFHWISISVDFIFIFFQNIS